MSNTLAQLIDRASTDAAFRAQLESAPETALAAYDLTAEEKAALMSGDTSKQSEMGMDSRVTKIDGSSVGIDDGAWPNTSFTG